jgi:TonB family protein
MASSLFRVIFRPALFILSLTYALALNVTAQADGRRVRIAVLDFGETSAGRVASEKFSNALAMETETLLVDRDLSRAAARGVGYSGSLNLSLPEARDLGAAIGSDFYIIGESQTLRRSPSTGPIYFESYASLFLVSARTGRLITWDRSSFQAASPQAAEKLLLAEITNKENLQRYFIAIKRAQEEERHEREVALERNTPVIEEAPDDARAEANGLQLPRPYKRLRPAYPDTAARADAEGTVDVLVDLDKEGEISRVEVARWAGFGLDQAAVDTARQLHFFPAMREGVAIPMRVLLRYNFRRPANQDRR